MASALRGPFMAGLVVCVQWCSACRAEDEVKDTSRILERIAQERRENISKLMAGRHTRGMR